jgi:hypothetical protein
MFTPGVATGVCELETPEIWEKLPDGLFVGKLEMGTPFPLLDKLE